MTLVEVYYAKTIIANIYSSPLIGLTEKADCGINTINIEIMSENALTLFSLMRIRIKSIALTSELELCPFHIKL